MPTQAIRASRGHAAAHITGNLWTWTAVFAAATALAGLLQLGAERRNIWGDLASLSGIVTGLLVMVKSQEGFVSAHAAPDEPEAESLKPDPARSYPNTPEGWRALMAQAESLGWSASSGLFGVRFRNRKTGRVIVAHTTEEACAALGII
jgi:hypothetical protein